MTEFANVSFEGPSLSGELSRKAFFIGRALAGEGEPADQEGWRMLANHDVIEENAEIEVEKGSATRRIIDRLLHAQDVPDIFDYQDGAKVAVDRMFEGVVDADVIDVLVATRNQSIVIDQAVGKQLLSEERKTRVSAHMEAFMLEIVTRTPNVQLRSLFNLPRLYERIYKSDSQSFRDSFNDWISHMRYQAHDKSTIFSMAWEGKEFRPTDPAELFKDYNQPLADTERNAINGNAAETIERLHLLHEYGIVPMAIEGKRVGFPWDIIISPSVRRGGDEYEEGAIADFFVLDMVDMDAVLASQDSTVREALGNTPIQQRFRLHHNGQISHGYSYHNIPSDATEQAFSECNVGDAFVRMRGLLIALAFDAVAPADVVRDRVGGSVASEYQKLREASPRKDPLPILLLRRQQELRRARVTPRNRRPEGWDPPLAHVRGHKLRLPEGARRRPTAEEEMREYYRKLKLPFPGLPDGYTFRHPFTRNQDAPDVVFRRARFRKSSATRLFLGSLGVSNE